MPLTESQVDAIKAFNLPPPLEVVESTVETKEEEKPDLVRFIVHIFYITSMFSY